MPQGIILSEHAFKRLTETVKRSERAYRNQRAHRRRNVSRGGGTSLAIATLAADLAAGSSASATFTVGGTGSLTVYDGLLCAGDSIASGSKVIVAKIAGKWYAIQSACPCL